ncbi:MAG TPA: transcriptional regulator [Candidatus Onthocola stercoravium]|nr:transcriptional regulator [Candidatus Onthocola stercoravium]
MKFDRLKEIREERNLTQRDIAKTLEVDRSTYAGWETGKDTIPLRRLNKLSDYYKISVDYMTGLSDVTSSYRVIDLDAKVIGQNLKEFRKERNLVQKDIFLFLNTTSSTYSAYETGKVLIKTDFLYSICKNYNASMDELLGKKN